MALNWAMIDADGTRPVPLPEEKIWLPVEKCQMSLEFKTPQAKKWEAKGTAYVTNQRVVFLRQPFGSATGGAGPSDELRSLNVPLTHLVDCRYMIPVFAAPYYEAGVIPVPGGNLPQPAEHGDRATIKGLLKIWFLEGGGAAFRDAVEEVRNLDRGGQHGEQLPAYRPQIPGTPRSGCVAPSEVAATVHSSLGGRTIAGGVGDTSFAGPSNLSAAPSRPMSRGASQLAPEDLEAARVAMREEEAEREAIRQRAEQDEDAPGVEATSYASPPTANAASSGADHPPAYSHVTTFVSSDDVDQQQQQHSQQVRAGYSRDPYHRRRDEAREAMLKLLASEEGRDRALQCAMGLSLVLHRLLGSRVRRPSYFGLWPIPHIIFLLFPRSLRRETLRRVHLSSGAADDLRRCLFFCKWVQVLARALLRLTLDMRRQVRRSGCGKGRTLGHSTTKGLDGKTSKSSDDAISSSTNQDGVRFNAEEIERVQALSFWQERLALLGEGLAAVSEIGDGLALIGGSLLVSRLIRSIGGGGYSASARRQQSRTATATATATALLSQFQVERLEYLALSTSVVGMAVQIYLCVVARRKARKALGKVHRQALLLTDQLADAQTAARTSHSDAHAHDVLETGARSRPSRRGVPSSSSSSSSSPRLLPPSPHASLSQRADTYPSSPSPLSSHQQDDAPRDLEHRTLASLSQAEQTFQTVRHGMKQAGLEIISATTELTFYGSSLLLPLVVGASDRIWSKWVEPWDACVYLVAGGAGALKVVRDA